MPSKTPPGYHTVTPSLTLKDSKKAMEFYKRAFGAEVLDCLPNPSGTGTMHATIQIGNSILMLGDEMPEQSCKSAETLGASPISLYVYMSDADSVFEQAVEAGASPVMPVADMFWGDRAGMVRDPFGYSWMIATHTKDLTPEEIRKGAENFFCQTEHHIVKTIELDAPIARVWSALTNHTEFGKWFHVRLDGPFVLGETSRGQITYPGYEHLKWEATVLKMEPEQLFAFSWHPYAVDPKKDYSKETPTLVEFRLKKTLSGTLLTITESGFEKIPSERRVEAFRMNAGGWSEQIKNIDAYLRQKQHKDA